MKIRSFKYLCVEGLKNVWANRLMSLASVGVLIACMLIMGVAIALSINADKALGSLEEQNVVMAFFTDEIGEDGARATTEKIAAMDNVSDAIFISKEQALENQKEAMGDEYESLFSFIDGENPMPNGAQIHLKDLSKIDETLENINQVGGIKNIRYSRETAEKITSIRSGINIAGTWIAVLLLIISFIIISNTIRITMYTRKLEISIMKAVGATDSFIRFPFLVEGIVLGIVSACITTGLTYAVYSLAIPTLNRTTSFDAIPYRDFALTLFLLFLFIGVVVGLVASSFMITKYLRKEGSEFRAL